jgi:hypothetical protein
MSEAFEYGYEDGRCDATQCRPRSADYHDDPDYTQGYAAGYESGETEMAERRGDGTP